MQHRHILTHYDEALEAAHTRVVSLTRDVGRSLESIERLVAECDPAWSARVEAGLEILASRVEEALGSCHNLLGQFQPVASDLRFIVSLIKACEKMEEAVRLLGTLASIGRDIATGNPEGCRQMIPLVSLACGVMEGAATALDQKDRELAKQVKKQDKQLDRLHKALIERVVEDGEERGFVAVDVDRIFFIRAAERIGDTGKGVARAVIQMYPRNKSVK